jgi:hypothetical protein
MTPQEMHATPDPEVKSRGFFMPAAFRADRFQYNAFNDITADGLPDLTRPDESSPGERDEVDVARLRGYRRTLQSAVGSARPSSAS